ncbi:MAG: hypothetical protein ACR2RV_19860, partial [Verrucomicrobiales bacterium]
MSPPPYELTDRELWSRIWNRLRPYRKRLIASVALLVFAVPFVNFHPLVWGFVADRLVEKSLTPGILGMWLAIMFGTYLVGLCCGAIQTYLLEMTGQA